MYEVEANGTNKSTLFAPNSTKKITLEMPPHRHNRHVGVAGNAYSTSPVYGRGAPEHLHADGEFMAKTVPALASELAPSYETSLNECLNDAHKVARIRSLRKVALACRASPQAHAAFQASLLKSPHYAAAESAPTGTAGHFVRSLATVPLNRDPLPAAGCTLDDALSGIRMPDKRRVWFLTESGLSGVSKRSEKISLNSGLLFVPEANWLNTCNPALLQNLPVEVREMRVATYDGTVVAENWTPGTPFMYSEQNRFPQGEEVILNSGYVPSPSNDPLAPSENMHASQIPAATTSETNYAPEDDVARPKYLYALIVIVILFIIMLGLIFAARSYQ